MEGSHALSTGKKVHITKSLVIVTEEHDQLGIQRNVILEHDEARDLARLILSQLGQYDEQKYTDLWKDEWNNNANE